MAIKTKTHVIDLDASPHTPYCGEKVSEHKRGGKFTWNPDKVKLFVHDKQQNGKTIKGERLYEELAKTAVFNACLLYYLLDNQHLIPNEWKVDENGKTRNIYFWGTIYRNSNGAYAVHSLYFDENLNRWRYQEKWLVFEWGDDDPCVVAV